MAERINNLDVQYSEADQDFEFSLQKDDPEISHPELSEAEQQGDSFPMQEVQRPDTSQPPSLGPAKHQSRKSNKISFIDRFAEGEESQNDSTTLLHSLILIFADAGAGGLSIQEAVRRMKKQSLPGLKEKGKAVQVAKVTRNHPDFVPCDNVGCFALRKTLLRSFQCGSLDPEEYADEKKMEAIVFEKYAVSAAAVPERQSSPRSSVQTPSLKKT